MRWRTFIAGFGILLFLTIYIALILNISDLLSDNLLISTIFYLLAGLAWIPFVVKLMGWAQRDQP
ncbi:MAG: DUF2842 domain-containing protein [Thalassobaculaceae bacterium]